MPQPIVVGLARCASWFVAIVWFGAASCAEQGSPSLPPNPVWRDLENKIFLEIQSVRADPDDYAERVIGPLKDRLVRFPRDARQPFLEYRAFLVGGTKIDYFTLDEGGSEETARAVLDETIDALRATADLPRLVRNDVLDRSARYYAEDFTRGGKQRDPHVDSRGRKAGPRIGSYGATRRALRGWQEFVDQLDADGTSVARVFRRNSRYYWLAFSGTRAYRYWSIPDQVGQFVTEHGRETTLARLDQKGHECSIRVDRQRRTLHHGDVSVAYPFALPAYGENVAWGAWSPESAARGMVCWWLLDPGIQNRGHRKLLLDPKIRYAGVGCARSPSVGWVTTFDACSEELVAYPQQ